MDARIKFNRGDIIFVVLMLVSLAALVNVFVLMSQYSSATNEQAVLMTAAYAEDAGGQYAKRMNMLREKAQAVASVASHYTDRVELDAYFNSLSLDDAYRAYIDDEVRYFYQDKEYNQYGQEIAAAAEDKGVMKMRRAGVTATYGIIYDEMGTEPRVACYCPVRDSEVLDGVLLYFTQDAVLDFTLHLDIDKLKYADLMAVCCQNNGGAQILKVLADSTDTVKINGSYYEAMSALTNDVAPSAQIAGILDSGASRTESVTLNGESYVLSIQRAGETDGGLYVIGLYKESTVYSSSYDLVQTAIITMTILLLVLIIFFIYFAASRHRIRKRLEQINRENPVLQCPTLYSFTREAKQIMQQNPNTAFYVAVAHIQHFAYIVEKYGEMGSQNILRHVRNIIKNAMQEGDTYGYIADGNFVLLLNGRESAGISNRLFYLYETAHKRHADDGIPEDYDLKMLFGIYAATDKSKKEQTIQQMVDKAVSVCDMPSRTDINQVCTFFDETARSSYMRKAEIENRMESALETGEFRVFYQPKYNLDKECIDGAEVLVRWYDPETKNYRSPAEFLPVFEENGFISKLDRHIFYSACETLAKWNKEGRPCFPISVNISRVTAIQNDFLEYYKYIKQYFQIADGYITLEFTESFAYENYEYLSTVASELRKAGFLCSIDDFGTGYSTYNVLKLLDMDEIKLDKFFLDNGAHPDVDRLILDSVISMGKRMGLKVTQEGVETLEQLELLREEGCNVIQGYFFARPMGGNDYMAFIDRVLTENPILKAEREMRQRLGMKKNSNDT